MRILCSNNRYSGKTVDLEREDETETAEGVGERNKAERQNGREE